MSRYALARGCDWEIFREEGKLQPYLEVSGKGFAVENRHGKQSATLELPDDFLDNLQAHGLVRDDPQWLSYSTICRIMPSIIAWMKNRPGIVVTERTFCGLDAKPGEIHRALTNFAGLGIIEDCGKEKWTAWRWPT
jgi:hypothetical protein